jgi:bisphosphoglycerate-independent phosphoglycerate mutase (AlkP superfamily)
LHRCDEYIRRIWEHIQIDEHYKNKTAMIITTDHGRGDRLSDWTEHDSNVEGSQYIWIACAGPHLTKRGDLNPCSRDTHTISNQNHTSTDYDVHTNQIAATILKLLGLDPREYSPNIGEPIAHFV